MIYGYVRVSTDHQTTENQKYEIRKYCKNNNLVIDEFICETISGTKEYGKRKLGKLLYKLKKDDILIASELSRLGRSLFMVMEILNYCLKKGCKIITIKDNFQLVDEIECKVLAFAFGLSAEIERKLISQRTKEALARLKSEGKSLGRPKGSKNKNLKVNKSLDKIRKYRNKNKSIIWISKKIGVHPNTLYNFLKNKKE